MTQHGHDKTEGTINGIKKDLPEEELSDKNDNSRGEKRKEWDRRGEKEVKKVLHFHWNFGAAFHKLKQAKNFWEINKLDRDEKQTK